MRPPTLQVFQPQKNEQNKKIDWAAIVISGLALVTSLISAAYLIKQASLTGGQVKAYVQVQEAKLVEPISDASLIKIQLKLKNFGQTAAINVHGDMEYDELIPNPNDSNYATLLKWGSMGPSFERVVTLTSNRRSRREWPSPSLRGDHHVYFFGSTVWYTDDTTGEKRKDDWCYELTIKTVEDLKKLDLEPCTYLTFASKKDPIEDF